MGTQKLQPATGLALLAVLVSLATAAFLVYMQTMQQQTQLREQEILDRFELQSVEFDSKMDETKDSFDQLIAKITCEIMESNKNNTRKKRQTGDDDSTGSDDDDAAKLRIASLGFLRGPPGLPGRDGRDGKIGQPGVPGLNGRDGRIGAVGLKGAPGQPGLSGARGPPGTTGQQGLPGRHGTPGDPGQHGNPGLPGSPGIPGTSAMLCPSWTRSSLMESRVIDGTCYVLVKQTKRWSDAQAFCQAYGFSLLTLETSTKQSQINIWRSNISSSSGVWTAGYRKYGRPTSEWFWRENNQDIPFGTYKDWYSSDPSYSHYCISYIHDHWHGRSCSSTYQFVCQGTQAQVGGGAVYTRWGGTTCANSSLTLYSGKVGGAKYDAIGGGVNYQCLPPDPELTDYNTAASDVSWMRSVEYESQSYNLFSSVIDNKHALCSVCYTMTRSAILMIPAKTSCPVTWVKEYSGFLMTAKENEQHPTTYECVDKDPKYVGLSPDDGGGRMWFVNVDCSSGGSLGDCSNYRHGRQVTCVVCSK